MDMREQSWADAMRAERRGDAVAYERLLKDVAEQLRRVIRFRLSRFGLNAGDAEDLVQEVLIGLHSKRHVWDETRPFMPWLHAIVHYKFVDAVRRLKREARYRIEMDFDEFSECLEAPLADANRTMLDLDRHVSGLPTGQREVVHALAVEGVSVRAAATRLKTSEGAIRVTFHRALQRLMARAELANASGVARQV